MTKRYTVALDGPAGAGKSTIAKQLASDLSLTYIDTGAMYRAVTLHLLDSGQLDLDDKKLEKELKKINIEFRDEQQRKAKGSRLKAQDSKVFLNGKDVSKKIRTSKVASKVSEVAAKKVVRKELVRRQQEMGKKHSSILDGRDIGTKVFKDADLKVYLTASSEVRAKRRIKDMKALGEKVSLKDMISEINRRDNYDSSRKESPLTKAQDAVVIDSSNMTVNQVVAAIKDFITSC